MSSAGHEHACSAYGLVELQSLFTEFHREILATLRRRTGSADIAADLAQDLFIKLPGIRAHIQNKEHGKAYLLRMARNLAVDYTRTETRRRQISEGVEVLFEDAEPGVEELAISRDQFRRVELALSELPERCSQVLLLGRVMGFSHKEIAAQLNVSVSLVEKYQLRALRHCSERLASDKWHF